MAGITLKQLISRAYELVASGWNQGEYYRSDAEIRGDYDGEYLVAEKRPQITSVCSVGAMRLAFAELVGAPIAYGEEWDYEKGEYVKYPYVDEAALIAHPLYVAGMKVLGKAFYEAEQLRDLLGQGLRSGHSQPEWLLNGEGGRPYDEHHVEGAIIEVNDSKLLDTSRLREEIIEAFRRAAEKASEDVTEEAFGDKPLESVTS